MILNVFKYKHKKSLKLLEEFLSKRKSIQKNKSFVVEKILRDVKKKEINQFCTMKRSSLKLKPILLKFFLQEKN